MDIRDPTFIESWRAASPEDRADHLFVLLGMTIVVLAMVGSAAFIAWLILLTGHPIIGLVIVLVMLGLALNSVFRR